MVVYTRPQESTKRLPVPTTLQAVIFDFDGVILESADIKSEAFLELFAAYPEHQAAILQHHLHNLGVSRFDKFAWIYRELLGRPFPESERERLGIAFSALVMEKVLTCPFVPGALELLAALAGTTLAFVASGTPQAELDQIVQRRALTDQFTGVWGTPLQKEQIIGHILEKHGLNRDDVLMVGDGTSDYAAATATGIAFVARDTAPLHTFWVAHEVPRVQDMTELLFGIRALGAADV